MIPFGDLNGRDTRQLHEPSMLAISSLRA